MSLGKFKAVVKNFPAEMYASAKECKMQGYDDHYKNFMKYRKKYYEQFKLYSAGNTEIIPEFMKTIHDGYLEQQKVVGTIIEEKEDEDD